MSEPPRRDRSPWTAFHARLHQTLRSRQLLPQGTRVLVAVSGGQDSLALLLLLHDLQPKWEWQLGVAHCDHGWRTDAAANAAWVMDLAQALGWPGWVRSRRDDPQAADDPPTEAAARAWRYRALAEMAIAENYATLVTAHTASDRAETLLHHLARGSGSDGLAALTWHRPLAMDGTLQPPTIPNPTLHLVRPFLEFGRDETAAICAQAGRSPWEDSTNADLRYTRNRLRQTVIPALQAAVNPQVERALARTAEILGDEADCLTAIAQTCLAAAIGASDAHLNPGSHLDPVSAPDRRFSPDPSLSPDPQAQPHSQASPDPHSPSTESPGGDRPLSRVNRILLRRQPIAIQRRALRLWLQPQLAIALDFATTEKAVRLLSAPNRSQSDPLPGGSWLRVCDRWLELWQPVGS